MRANARGFKARVAVSETSPRVALDLGDHVHAVRPPAALRRRTVCSVRRRAPSKLKLTAHAGVQVQKLERDSVTALVKNFPEEYSISIWCLHAYLLTG